MNEGQLIIDYQKTLERNMSLILENAKLQQKIDKAIEYNEHLIRDAKYHLNLGHLKKMKKILLGDKEDE